VTDFRNFRPKKEEAKKRVLKKRMINRSDKKTNFMDAIELPKEVTIGLVYPEIPVSQGPEGYWGLPGLILEVNDGKTIIFMFESSFKSRKRLKLRRRQKKGD
jgi:hypothetical protein